MKTQKQLINAYKKVNNQYQENKRAYLDEVMNGIEFRAYMANYDKYMAEWRKQAQEFLRNEWKHVSDVENLVNESNHNLFYDICTL